MAAEIVPISRSTDRANGFGAAAEALYVTHRGSVFKYLRAMTGDEEEALDLTADAFERAFRQIARGHVVGIGWLMRTARNGAIDRSRRDQTRRRSQAGLRIQGETAVGPEAAAIANERAHLVLAAVARLPRPQRDAIALRYSTDLTVRQIAVVVGKNESATQKLIARGLAVLKESLDDLD